MALLMNVAGFASMIVVFLQAVTGFIAYGVTGSILTGLLVMAFPIFGPLAFVGWLATQVGITGHWIIPTVLVANILASPLLLVGRE